MLLKEASGHRWGAAVRGLEMKSDSCLLLRLGAQSMNANEIIKAI